MSELTISERSMISKITKSFGTAVKRYQEGKGTSFAYLRYGEDWGQKILIFGETLEDKDKCTYDTVLDAVRDGWMAV